MIYAQGQSAHKTNLGTTTESFLSKCYVIYKIDTPGRGEGEDFQKWSSLLGGRGEVVVSNVVLEKTMWCVVCVSR